LDIIKLLVKFGANIRVRTHYGTGCILCAAYQGHFSVVKYLVEIDPEMLLSRPFEAQEICRQAIDRGDQELLRLLMEIGHDFIAGDNCPCDIAI
jgi:hypothetical protein